MSLLKIQMDAKWRIRKLRLIKYLEFKSGILKRFYYCRISRNPAIIMLVVAGLINISK